MHLEQYHSVLNFQKRLTFQPDQVIGNGFNFNKFLSTFNHCWCLLLAAGKVGRIQHPQGGCAPPSSDLSHRGFEPPAPTPAARMTSPLSANIQANCSTVIALYDQKQCTSERNSTRLMVKENATIWPQHLCVRKIRSM